MSPQVALVPDWTDIHFNVLEQGLNGSKAHPFHGVRRRALESFKKVGLPSPSLEEWKYTNLTVLQREDLLLAPRESLLTVDDLARIETNSVSGPRLVFVDGHWREDLSTWQDCAGVTVESLRMLTHGSAASNRLASLGALCRAESHPFASLGTAFLSDGVVLSVARGVVLPAPITLVFLSLQGKVARYPRVLLRAGENSECCVVEEHIDAESSSGFSCAITEIHAETAARVRHVKVQRESLETIHVGLIGVALERSARVDTSTLSFGGRLVRNEVQAVLGGEHAQCNLFGLTVLTGAQHVDNSTVLDHQQPHCDSRENYKGIYAQKSRGVFSGTIIVQPGAQKTNAFQSNRSVLLSDEASIDTRPQLKIWADDVKCTHGATVGQLDEEALFYARARGISRAEAERMLVTAFASEIVAEVGIDPLKEYIAMLIEQKLRLSQ